jgi:hypothetical protein
MSGDELQVERDALKRNATGFGDGAKALEAVFNRLTAALAAEGNCWGNDDTGKAFEKNYTKPKQDALDTFTGLAKSLRGIEKGVRTMATNYDAAEHASGG